MSDNKQRRGAKGSRRAPLKATQPKSAKKQKKGPLPGTVENSLKKKGGFHERFLRLGSSVENDAALARANQRTKTAGGMP